MAERLADETAFRRHVLLIPKPALTVEGEKIGYRELSNHLAYGPMVRAAFKTIAERCDLGALCELVEETPGLTDLMREFYKMVLRLRYEEILLGLGRG